MDQLFLVFYSSSRCMLNFFSFKDNSYFSYTIIFFYEKLFFTILCFRLGTILMSEFGTFLNPSNIFVLLAELVFFLFFLILKFLRLSPITLILKLSINFMILPLNFLYSSLSKSLSSD